jgi:hypothetical protein
MIFRTDGNRRGTGGKHFPTSGKCDAKTLALAVPAAGGIARAAKFRAVEVNAKSKEEVNHGRAGKKD